MYIPSFPWFHGYHSAVNSSGRRKKSLKNIGKRQKDKPRGSGMNEIHVRERKRKNMYIIIYIFYINGGLKKTRLVGFIRRDAFSLLSHECSINVLLKSFFNITALNFVKSWWLNDELNHLDHALNVSTLVFVFLIVIYTLKF